ncbi:TIGR02757 family protein [Leptospira wolffii]|uniref:TIGR02757 family protein n=1 Tax=Leptospira wolffii TaxID=409998 RepID=UPI0010836C68|nr:TIGR02757 family protein [Leptospira wolffii]TGK58290.1 TIGR02757 family protein [Leptospira wolffii]TGK66333.1 TIGR02757 family protein [Leptospira wolffii]TGK68968.1 TIGR02757 family protein [Leptospira wolffii]TGL27320.1 TIGR02757 family protein [Leptospira wolffii]
MRKSESSRSVESFQKSFDRLYDKYTRPDFLDSDPLFLCYLYDSPEDRELVGLLSALFAYGNVSAIRGFLSRLLAPMGKHPKRYLLTKGTDIWKGKLGPYRFQKEKDVLLFLEALRFAYGESNRKGNKLLEHWFSPLDPKESGLEKRILGFQSRLSEVLRDLDPNWKTYGLGFLIGIGNEKSAHKRYCMFLRWMVRTEAPDLGLYKNILPEELIFPLDTHINRLAEILGATNRKTSDYKKAKEVTDFFRNYYPRDPLRMDFALCRLGILRKCKSSYVRELCETCELNTVCSVYSSKRRSKTVRKIG